MSRLQFRCTILILRHAWLNLWDKHMTTGRINQVAAERVQVCLERRSRLSWRVGWYQRSLSRRSGKVPWWERGLYFFKVRPRTSFELVTQKICVAPLQPSEPPKDIASLDLGSGKTKGFSAPIPWSLWVGSTSKLTASLRPSRNHGCGSFDELFKRRVHLYRGLRCHRSIRPTNHHQ